MYLRRKIFLPSLLRLQSSQIDDTSQLNTQSDPEKPHCDNIDAVENDDSSHGAANSKQTQTAYMYPYLLGKCVPLH